MKAIIDTDIFKNIIKSTAKFTRKSVRPILEYIRLDFDKDSQTVKAFATDGYKVSIETGQCIQVDESFTAHIRPYLPIGASHRHTVIELLNDNCLIDIGGCIVGTKQPKEPGLNYDEIIKSFEEQKIVHEIAVSNALLVDTLKSVNANKPVVIQLRDGLGPLSIKTDTGIRYVLPVRRNKD